jgi:hypothetical protein
MSIAKGLRNGTVALVALGMLAGCGESSKRGALVARSPSTEPAAASGHGAADDAEEAPPPMTASAAPVPAGGSADTEPGARESSSGAMDRAPSSAPRPRERPGLGTEWGETRASHVRDVTFARRDDDQPYAVATLHYDDERGVDAMARYRGGYVAPRAHAVETAGGAVSVSIMDGDGDPLATLRLGDRDYVVGRGGERYTIALTNRTGHAFEAVATVDGLDVISGKVGSLANRGYVLSPYATVSIDGFRQSQDAVAAFRFAKVADSYAAQTGRARNVGVIGVAIFAQRGDRFDVDYTDQELRTRDTARPFPVGRDPRYAPPPPGR